MRRLVNSLTRTGLIVAALLAAIRFSDPSGLPWPVFFLGVGGGVLLLLVGLLVPEASPGSKRATRPMSDFSDRPPSGAVEKLATPVGCATFFILFGLMLSPAVLIPTGLMRWDNLEWWVGGLVAAAMLVLVGFGVFSDRRQGPR